MAGFHCIGLGLRGVNTIINYDTIERHEML